MTASQRVAPICMLAMIACVPFANAADKSDGPHTAAGHGATEIDLSKFDLAAIRKATMRFKNVKVAEKEGYGQFLGCVSGPTGGAMGIHFANGNLVGDGVLDPLKPEVLIYEPNGNKLELVGMEYVVIAEAWHAKNEKPPVMLGQTFHYSPSPNRYGMPPHYELHIWAWRKNPGGTFVDWNSKVVCDK